MGLRRSLQPAAGGSGTLRVALAACVLLAVLAFPASAAAKRGLVTGLEGHGLYESGDPATRKQWFDRTADAGAGIVRLGISWAAVAPAPPADPTNPSSYDLTPTDRAVRSAAATGIEVLITVNIAPPWAEGPGRPADANTGSWAPNPSQAANFLQAVAARYSGSFDPDGPGTEPPLPRADAIQVWNEPNQDFWLAPQFQGKTIIGPDRYREILNESYKAIKSVNPRMLVVTGGTSPYGDPPGGPYPAPPQGARVRPVQWWQDLFCVRPVKKKKKGKKGKKKAAKQTFARTSGCPGKPMFDVLAHQPIDNTGRGPLAHGPNRFDASTPDLGRVVSVLRAAERLGTVSGGRHPVWVTEFWWDSKPPNPVGAPLALQARWLQQSLFLFWKAGASTAINFAMQDTTEFPRTRNGFQSGLYFGDGRPKPALTAFRFPFVAERLSVQTLGAWGKSPESGNLAIQRQQGRRWITVKRLRVGEGAVFQTKLRLRGKQRLRARVGSSQSLVWKQAGSVKKDSNDDSGVGSFILPLAGGLALALVTAAVLRRRQVARRRQRSRRRPSPGDRLTEAAAG